MNELITVLGMPDEQNPSVLLLLLLLLLLQAVGCSVDLRELQKPYCLKKGLCPKHIKVGRSQISCNHAIALFCTTA
jgi:hypothetical protein